MSAITLQVALPVPLSEVFDYRHNTPIAAGYRVMVPFGKRKMIGVVVSSDAPTHQGKLRAILEVLDESPVITDNQVKLLKWISRYYHAAIGMVYQHALTPYLRKPNPSTAPNLQRLYQINGDVDEIKRQLSRAPRQRAVIEYLQRFTASDAATLRKALAIDSTILKQLQTKGFIASTEDTPAIALAVEVSDKVIVLNPEQQAAVEAIDAQPDQFSVSLLHGITGSGKTEVYLQAIKNTLSRGKSALVLVPEIALTPQLVRRFSEHFPTGLVVQHSGLTTKQRYESWWQVSNQSQTIVIGTRSAIYLPFQNLGLIVVDEEHDMSFKQYDGVRYHARDCAVMLARYWQAPIVLGSATPSLESYQNALSERYQLLTLKARYGDAKLPTMGLIDINQYRPQQGISKPLTEAIAEHLQNKGQVIIFLNRRGFAPMVLCSGCQWQARCQRCDAFLTLHQRRHALICHHCGHQSKALEQCPSCAGDDLYHMGVGTQQIEAQLRSKFPQHEIQRLDRDNTTTTKQLSTILKRMADRQIDILLGTQLIVKGHDFPHVTLVGVVDSDQGLFSSDFRGPEYLMQQMIQVAGRAGRADSPGEVLIQTRQPEHPIFAHLRHHDYTGFAKMLLNMRSQAAYPPFSHLLLLRADSVHDQQALSLLEDIATIGRRLRLDERFQTVEIMDAITSPMQKLAGRYRAQLLVRCANRAVLQDWLARLLSEANQLKGMGSARFHVDVDPMDMY